MSGEVISGCRFVLVLGRTRTHSSIQYLNDEESVEFLPIWQLSSITFIYSTLSIVFCNVCLGNDSSRSRQCFFHKLHNDRLRDSKSFSEYFHWYIQVCYFQEEVFSLCCVFEDNACAFQVNCVKRSQLHSLYSLSNLISPEVNENQF